MASVYEGDVWLEKILGTPERMLYALAGINPMSEMSWRGYAMAVLSIGLFGFLLLFGIFIGQGFLPGNPQHFTGLAPDLAFNAAISFVTNTDWQSYSGESTLSYFSQAAGVTVQNFLSAATGMSVAVALFRGLVRKESVGIGNAYVDMVRSVLYILLPLSFVFAVILMSQGVIETWKPYAHYVPLEAIPDNASPVIALGPVASQEAIKMLGSNGGGFFGANSAYPYENTTPLCNLLELIAILLLPAAFVYTFGVMVGEQKQAGSIFGAMVIIFVPLMALCVYAEHMPNPHLPPGIVDQSLGNMEGKELRFGATASALWAAETTATSNGSANASFDSFTPLGGLVPLLLIQLGEVVFGGLGSGMYGMLMFVLLTVFIGGLMVGRTPEYLGKKLGVFEIKMASLVILIPAAIVLLGTAIAVSTEVGRAGLFNNGSHGFSEILYAFSSAGNNNGSAFGGLSANSPFYNIALGLVMFIGRYWVIVPVLAIAGSIAAKKSVPVSAGTLPTHTPLFTCMLVGVVIIIGVLTYVPALALGPIASQMHFMDLSK